MGSSKTKRVRLQPRLRKFRDQEWTLELGMRNVVVYDSDEEYDAETEPEPIAEFGRHDAEKRFHFPGFWDNRKHFGIELKDGVHDFDVSPRGMEIIKEYLEDALLARGPRAIQSVFQWGMMLTIGGILLAVLAVVGSVASYQAAAAQPQGGTYYVCTGLVITGLAGFSKGIANLLRYGRLCRQMRERDSTRDAVPDDE